MKTNSIVRSLCTGCLLALAADPATYSACDAFVINTAAAAVAVQHVRLDRLASLPQQRLRPQQHDVALFSSHRVRDVRRTRGGSRSDAVMSASFGSSGSGEQGAGRSAYSPSPSGPGAGVVDLQFWKLKTGGFKVFLLFFLLGQGRAKDNDTPFSVRDTPEGIRVLIGDESKDNSQWDGVLDLSWGMEPRPYFRVDRIDVNEVIPYPGELYILNKLVDAIIDVNGEREVDDDSKLFLFANGEQAQLSATKAKLASLSSL